MMKKILIVILIIIVNGGVWGTEITGLTQGTYNSMPNYWEVPPPTNEFGIPVSNELIPANQFESNYERGIEVFKEDLGELNQDSRDKLISKKYDAEIKNVPENAKVDSDGTLRDANGQLLAEPSKNLGYNAEFARGEAGLVGFEGPEGTRNLPQNTYPKTCDTGCQTNAPPQQSGGGGGGSGSGGGWDEKIVGILQSIASFIGNFASLKQQDKTAPDSSPGQVAVKEGPYGKEFEFERETLGFREELGSEQQQKSMTVAQGIMEESGYVRIPDENSLKETTHKNTETNIFKGENAIATITTPTGTYTDVTHNASSQEPFSAETETTSSPSLTTTAAITGQAIQEIPGQYFKLINHNIDMSGKDITVDVLKSFENAEAGGQNLKIISGDTEIKFQGQKIMYPRLVKKAPHGILQISNKLDQNNKYRLKHYTNKKSQLIDNNQRITVSDITAKHPEKKLIISKIRLPMWNF